jgi:hypothetical protein
MKSSRPLPTHSATSSNSFNNVKNVEEYHQYGNTIKSYYYTHKDNPLLISNYRPIALANNIYKFCTKHPHLLSHKPHRKT